MKIIRPKLTEYYLNPGKIVIRDAFNWFSTIWYLLNDNNQSFVGVQQDGDTYTSTGMSDHVWIIRFQKDESGRFD